LFLDTGLGKTICQLEWARQIPGEVLILAPVAVAPQTVREAKDKLGITINHSRDGSVTSKITITNYERLHLFDSWTRAAS
jgi:superfamily II DNA or RNA helicase